MKNRSKLWSFLGVCTIAAMLAGCAGTQAPKENEGKVEKKVFKIGVIQYVQHQALDASYQGFLDALKDAGYTDGDNLAIEYQNAAGDASNCQTIADSFINDKKDLILAIATPAAQAVAMKTTEIPILVTAVTDPFDAGLVESNELPGRNVSGTSDLTPIKEQIELVKELLPDAKNISILYASNEANSVFQADIAEEAAKANGLASVRTTVSNSNELQQVVASIADKVDAIYTPTDNMIAAGMATVALVANEAKLPVICGESGMVEAGGLITYGINYYDLGLKTGKQAARVFKGEDISKMPIEYLETEDLEVTINQATVEAIGLTIPESIASRAKK